MDYWKSFPALEGLADLADRGDVDINPTLLRVLTDLYVEKTKHTHEEERQYTELALRLIEVVDISARHRLAQRLANYPSAPAPIVRRLANDVIAVAEPILRHSQVLSREELHSIAQAAGNAHLAALATREPVTVQSAPRAQRTTIVPIDDVFAGRIAAAAELNELFFAANAAERRTILLYLDFATLEPAKAIEAVPARDAVLRIEAAALAHNGEAFARELARALGIAHDDGRRLASDASGEPVVIAAKALGMPANVLQRILLCLDPAISQSVPRVYELADLFEALKPEAALRMLAIWQALARKPRTAMHQPLYVDDKTRPRPDTVASRRRPVSTPDQRTGGKRA